MVVAASGRREVGSVKAHSPVIYECVKYIHHNRATGPHVKKHEPGFTTNHGEPVPGHLHHRLVKERHKTCRLEPRMTGYRCSQEICDFADGLDPDLPRTSSDNAERPEHLGVLVNCRAEALNYAESTARSTSRKQEFRHSRTGERQRRSP